MQFEVMNPRVRTGLTEKQLPLLSCSKWTNSYFCATVGGVTLETLKRYVEGQKSTPQDQEPTAGLSPEALDPVGEAVSNHRL
jgi:REP element-mobilizing transposase RayT